MPESYNAGERRPRYGQNHRLSENRYAWVTTELGKFMILVGEDEGHGSDIVLFHPKPGRQPDVAIKLTNMTKPELDAFRDLLTNALEWAEPVVVRRDKEAQDAWDSGDDSHSRNYRALPTVVYRKRPVGEHSEGIRQRSSGVPQGSGGERRDQEGRVRGAGDELAEPHSSDGQPQDDGAETDEREVFWEVDDEDSDSAG